MADLTVKLIRAADCPNQRWRNGAGWTRVLAQEPQDADLDSFAWRLSVAEICSAGPFSVFSGVERQLVMCDGVGLSIVVDGEHHILHPGELVRFHGAAAVSCALADGRATALNVMTRTGLGTASVTIERAEADHVLTAPADAGLLVVALTASTSLGSQRLAPLDALCLQPGEPAVLSGGDLVVITVAPVGAQHQSAAQ